MARTRTFTDERGRRYAVSAGPDVPETELHLYPVAGPPDVVDELDLPEAVRTRLHNALYERGLFSTKELKRQPQALLGALQAALNVDVQRLAHAYQTIETKPSDEGG